MAGKPHEPWVELNREAQAARVKSWVGSRQSAQSELSQMLSRLRLSVSILMKLWKPNNFTFLFTRTTKFHVNLKINIVCAFGSDVTFINILTDTNQDTVWKFLSSEILAEAHLVKAWWNLTDFLFD